PPPERRAEIARELAWWGFHGVREDYESPQEIEARITMRERLLEELGDGEETAAARAELHYTLGGLYWVKKDYEKALHHFNESLKLAEITENERLEAWAWYGLGIVYSDQGCYEEAIEAYRKAIELDSKFAAPWNGLGNVYYKQGRYEKAIEAYRNAIELDPKYAYPWNGLGWVYYEQGRYEEAIEAYRKAIELNPRFAAPWNSLGNVYYEQGRYEEAIEAYRKVIELNPNRGATYCALASIYRRLGRQKELEEHIRKARELLPPDDHYNRACLESICGNVEEALEHLKLALEKDPGMKEWAKRDPDLEWIREDERFWELVG
ncbi:MAG: hypothetical protein DRI61_09160, partial [Chloroflexi bacterium]